MISLCFRKIPSPPPTQPLCENESEIPVHTRGIQTCVGTPRRNPHLHGPARFICTSPSFSNSPSPQPGLREGSRVPSVFRPTARPRVVHLPHPSSHRAHHAIPQHAGRHSLLRAFAPAVLAVQNALSHMSAWLTPSPPSGFCKNVIFSGRPFLITLFTAPQHTACHHPALPFSKVPATIRHAVCLTEVTVQCFSLPSKRKAL